MGVDMKRQIFRTLVRFEFKFQFFIPSQAPYGSRDHVNTQLLHNLVQ